jgi:hypothetical protein
MHLLYLDDAGSSTNPQEEYLVLGGVSVFESQAYWITKELDDLAATISADPTTVEFHASEIFGRRSVHGGTCHVTKHAVSLKLF